MPLGFPVMDITSLYLKFPDCFGCYCSDTCCYWKIQETCCKKSDIEGELCVGDQLRCVTVMPTTCCSGINQCFCFDYRCTCPMETVKDNAESVPCMVNIGGCMLCLDGQCKMGLCQSVKTLRNNDGVCVPGWCATCDCFSSEKTYDNPDNIVEVKTPAVTAGLPEVGYLKPCLGCSFLCNLMATCFCKMPDVFGCFSNCTCCCCREQELCFKPAVEKGDVFNGEVCICCERKCVCLNFRFCPLISGVMQHCCIDVRFSFPSPDYEFLPCICNLCYVNCCFSADSKDSFGQSTKCGCTFYQPLSQFMDGEVNMASFRNGGSKAANGLAKAEVVVEIEK